MCGVDTWCEGERWKERTGIEGNFVTRKKIPGFAANGRVCPEIFRSMFRFISLLEYEVRSGTSIFHSANFQLSV
jgi:hypothetical protein